MSGRNMPSHIARTLLAIRARITKARFGNGDWQALGDVTGLPEIVLEHPRLLRSLRFGDDDYESSAYDVLKSMHQQDSQVIGVIGQFLNENYPDESTRHASVSTSGPRLTITPTVFDTPSDIRIDDTLVSVMMPYDRGFDAVWQTIVEACHDLGLQCHRAKDIWETHTVIQDIFNLLFRSKIVVVDFSQKNANVMYETGIAHTLGRDVVPISQSLDDIPFDMKHHRVLKYLPNSEGLSELRESLTTRLRTLSPPKPQTGTQSSDPFDDDVPF